MSALPLLVFEDITSRRLAAVAPYLPDREVWDERLSALPLPGWENQLRWGVGGCRARIPRSLVRVLGANIDRMSTGNRHHR